MIEDTIIKLTASIEALTVAINAQKFQVTEIIGAERTKVLEKLGSVDKPAKADKVKNEKKVEAAKAEEAPKVEETKTEAPAKTEEKPAAGATIADVRDAAQKCLDAGKLAAVVAINKEYGIKRISEAPEAKYAEVVAKLTEALNG